MSDEIVIKPITSQPTNTSSNQSIQGSSATSTDSTQTETTQNRNNPGATLGLSIDSTSPQFSNSSTPTLPNEESKVGGGTDYTEKYNIPTLVRQKYPELIELIKTTESMGEEEREYWFQIMPIMNEEQINRLKEILINEKEQLAKLDQDYETELNRLNEKHMLEWHEFEIKEKRAALLNAESASRQEEAAKEEELLAKLGDL